MAVSIAERHHSFSFEEYAHVAERSPVRVENWEGAILDMWIVHGERARPRCHRASGDQLHIADCGSLRGSSEREHLTVPRGAVGVLGSPPNYLAPSCRAAAPRLGIPGRHHLHRAAQLLRY